MQKVIANIISVIFHPLLMPTYVLLLIIWFNPFLFTEFTRVTLVTILISVFVYTFIFPVVITFLLYKIDIVKSIQLDTAKERLYPFALALLFYGYIYFRFRSLPYPQILSLTLLSAMLAISITIILNIKWKVSIHCVGIALLAGIIFYNSDISSYDIKIPFMVILFIAGIIGSSRLSLLKHRPAQIYIGYLVGWGSSMLIDVIF